MVLVAIDKIHKKIVYANKLIAGKNSRYYCINCNEELTYIVRPINHTHEQHIYYFRHEPHANCNIDTDVEQKKYLDISVEFINKWLANIDDDYKYNNFDSGKQIIEVTNKKYSIYFRSLLCSQTNIDNKIKNSIGKKIVWILSITSNSKIDEHPRLCTLVKIDNETNYILRMKECTDITYFDLSICDVYLDDNNNIYQLIGNRKEDKLKHKKISGYPVKKIDTEKFMRLILGHAYNLHNSNLIKKYLSQAEEGDIESMRKIAQYYKKKKDYINMKQYYLMAIRKGCSQTMYNLGEYYEDQKDYSNMKDYYLLAINNGYIDAMLSLGNHYRKIDDEENMKKYYLMAIENNSPIAMYFFGKYYSDKKDYVNMIKYLTMATEKGSYKLAMYDLGQYYEAQQAYNNMVKYYSMLVENESYPLVAYRLGQYFEEKQDYNKMIKYYSMAISDGNIDAMLDLGNYYWDISDYENMQKCYVMALNEGSTIAILYLGYYSEEMRQYEDMIKYYKMAADKGNGIAMYGLGMYYYEKGDYHNMFDYLSLAYDSNIISENYLVKICLNINQPDVLVRLYDKLNKKNELLLELDNYLCSKTNYILKEIVDIILDLDTNDLDRASLAVIIINKLMKK